MDEKIFVSKFKVQRLQSSANTTPDMYVIWRKIVLNNQIIYHRTLVMTVIHFFFFSWHCNPCGLWPDQLSLSILSRKLFTEFRCQRHVKPPTWRTS